MLTTRQITTTLAKIQTYRDCNVSWDNSLYDLDKMQFLSYNEAIEHLHNLLEEIFYNGR